MKSAKMTEVIAAISAILGTKATIKVTGLRPGEKLVESIDLDELGNEIDTTTVPRLTKKELIKMIKASI